MGILYWVRIEIVITEAMKVQTKDLHKRLYDNMKSHLKK